MVGEELKKSGKGNLLPAGIVLSGGGIRLEGVVDLAKKRLKLPVEIGRVREVKSDFSEFFNPDSATLAGILLYQHEKENDISSQKLVISSEKRISGDGFWAKAKEWFSELIP
jgi:cell division protein FtsA